MPDDTSITSAPARKPPPARFLALAVIAVGGILLAVLAPSSPDVAGAASQGWDIHLGNADPVTAFYDTKGIPPAPAGTAIRHEDILPAPSGVKIFRYLYHSSDNQGAGSIVSGLLTIPDTVPPPGGFPVIGFAHGTTGVNQHCGISLAPNTEGSAGFPNFTKEIVPLAQQGWAVAATDYQGLGAPGAASFLVGKVEGQNVLDAMRAAHELRPDLNVSQNIIWGHSQGGNSASFAAQLWPSYAPELKVLGAVVLAPAIVPTLPAAIEAITGLDTPGGQAGFLMLIAKSWKDSYPGEFSIADMLTPAAIEQMGVLDTMCSDDVSTAYMQKPMNAYFKQPPDSFYALANLNTPGAIPLQMPLYLAQGLQDITIIPQATLALSKLHCVRGDTVKFQIYPNDDHESLIVASRPLADEWIRDRLAGMPAPDTCPTS